MDDDLNYILIIVGCVLIGISIFILSFIWIGVTFVDNIPSQVFVDGKLIYEGSSAGFNIESGGYTTTVTIYGGFLYLFPQQTYTSKDVVVIGSK